jgi:hypothetical protein
MRSAELEVRDKVHGKVQAWDPCAPPGGRTERRWSAVCRCGQYGRGFFQIKMSKNKEQNGRPRTTGPRVKGDQIMMPTYIGAAGPENWFGGKRLWRRRL